ncbi:MAG TPA: GAF domain-containing protein [Anaerolineales bacterium]|nr:GAF domain-containing protein [Anaerolineales bacterium]
MWNSLRVRLTLIFIGLAIIPLIAVGGILFQTTDTADRAQAIALQSQVAQNATSQIVNYIQGLNQNLIAFGSQLSGLSTPDLTIESSLLSSALHFSTYGSQYKELALLDPQGHEIIRTTQQGSVPESQLLDHSKSDDFLQPASTRQVYYGPIETDSTTHQPYLEVSIPLYATGNGRTSQLTGVLIGKLSVTPLENLLAQTQPGSSQTLYMTDDAGKVVAHQDPSFNLQNARIVLPSGGGAVQAGINHTNVVMATSKIQLGTETFFVIAEQPTSLALALATSLIRMLTLSIVIALILAAAVGFVVVRQIVLPIENLATTAKQIAAGDLAQTAAVRGRDEIGALANAFNDMTSQLRGLVGSLEARVSERTQELERETLSVRTAAEVARDIASASNLDELLTRSGQLIVERFNFYHTGIFLLDDKKEFAVLRASPTEAGRQLIANGHRLRVGEQGIVGRVAATGEARIALDTGADAVYFNNPYLPTTRSEMALPLKTRNEILGILDIQSDQPQAFAQEDIEILQVMADQLATAIESTRLMQRVENQLTEIEQTYQEFTRQSWRALALEENHIAGYKFDGVQLQPIDRAPENGGTGDSTASATASGDQASGPRSQIIPIRLRGETIGLVNIRFRGDSAPDETMSIVEQVTDRLATALENARLAEETRERARRDELVGELSGNFRSTLDLETVVRTAAQELRKAFQLEEAEVRLGFPITGSEEAAKIKSKNNGGSHE